VLQFIVMGAGSLVALAGLIMQQKVTTEPKKLA